jgi:hypothetical protein
MDPDLAGRRPRQDGAPDDDARENSTAISVTDHREAVALRLVVDGLLGYSDLLDAELRLRLATWRDGYREGHKAGYAAGFADGVLDRKHAQRDLLQELKVCARRWTVRGEPRARETFSRPHPDDFTGQGAA